MPTGAEARSRGLWGGLFPPLRGGRPFATVAAGEDCAAGARGWLAAEAPRRFCGCFAATFVLGVAAAAGLNLAVDPYAQYGTGWLPPVVHASRSEKLALMAAAGPCDALILGSSRAMKFEPDYLRQRAGLAAFNASVHYGRCEDFLALLRASRTAWGAWPRLAVVGLDVDALVAQPGVDAQLLRTEALCREIPELLSWSDRVRPFRELLSWDQTKQSLRSWRRGEELARRHAGEETFTADGVVQYHRRQREMEAGSYDFAAALAYNQREYARLYAGYRGLHPMRVEAWRELAETCRRERIALVVFLTTWQPEMLHGLANQTPFAERRAEVAALVRSTLGDADRFCDFTELGAYGGDADQFVDGVHPLEPNARRMIDVLFPAGWQPSAEAGRAL